MSEWSMIFFFYNKNIIIIYLCWPAGQPAPFHCWLAQAVGYAGWAKAGQEAILVSPLHIFW